MKRENPHTSMGAHLTKYLSNIKQEPLPLLITFLVLCALENLGPRNSSLELLFLSSLSLKEACQDNLVKLAMPPSAGKILAARPL